MQKMTRFNRMDKYPMPKEERKEVILEWVNSHSLEQIANKIYHLKYELYILNRNNYELLNGMIPVQMPIDNTNIPNKLGIQKDNPFASEKINDDCLGCALAFDCPYMYDLCNCEEETNKNR